MTMGIAERAAAVLETLSTADLEAMQPAARRRFADRCRRLADLCDRCEAPKGGVLADLRNGRTDL
jgi:hypothetical protein